MSAQRSGGSALAGWPQLPQVNLLPPEFLEARSLVRVKRLLAVVVVAVLVVAIGLVAVSKLQANKAEDALLDAQNDSASLSAEIATYGDVTATLSQLTRAKLAQIVAMSTDVLWADRLQALNAVLPSSASYEIYTVESSTPMARLAAVTDVLAPLSLAHVTIQARLTAPPDIPAILDALQSVPAVQDVRVSSVVVAGDDVTPQYWKLTGDVSFSDEAASHRFDQTEDAK